MLLSSEPTAKVHKVHEYQVIASNHARPPPIQLLKGPPLSTQTPLLDPH